MIEFRNSLFGKIHSQLVEQRERGLQKWGTIRLEMLTVPMVVNTLLYYLTMKEIEEIIDQLIDGADVKNAQRKDLVKRCFGLCCYWKINEDRGAVEFLHNN